MSGAALGWAKAQRAPSMIAKAVLICLADYADADGIAWPSVPSLAKEVQVSDRTVQRALKSLADDGLVEIAVRARKDGGQTSNGYRLAMGIEPPGDCVSPPRCQAVTPPVTLQSPATEPPLEHSPSDDGERAPAPKGKTRPAYPADFDLAWRAYPHHEGRSSKPRSLEEWKKLPREERDALPAAIDRFRPKVAVVCGGKGAPDMARWLRDGKHLSWGADNDAGPAAARPAFNGPAALRLNVVKALGEDFAAGWIDPCTWREDGRVLVCRNAFVRDTLARELGPRLQLWNVILEVAPANTNTPQEIAA